MTAFTSFLNRHRRRLIIALGISVCTALAAWMLQGRLTEPIDSYAKCTEAGYPVTDSDPPACQYGNHLFIGPRVSPSPSAPEVTSVPYEILVNGDSLGQYPARQEVISDPVTWQRYWREVHASLAQLPPLLPVDFNQSDVVALSEGRKPTGGYNIKVTTIAKSAAGTSINVTESMPGETCNLTQSFTNRYLLVRTAKLTPPVSFRITSEKRECR